MIAANYRKFPEAMALQLVLVFGRPVWNSSRPTTRIGRALRNAQAVLVKAKPQVVRWVKVTTPQWFRDQARRAKALAKLVKSALTRLVWDEPETGKASVPTKGVWPGASWKVDCLISDYEDEHHGNQAHFFSVPMSMDTPAWFHIASGSLLTGASRGARRYSHPDGMNRA